MTSPNYAQMYNDYWQRPDRFGSRSFSDADELARRVLRVCGVGSVLDVGCGFGALVRSLLRIGIDAQGVDVSDVPVQHANSLAPGRFKIGSILQLPFADDSFDTIVCTDCLEHIAPDDVPRALQELARVARRNVFIVVSTVQDRDATWHLTIKDRDWWELACFTAGESTGHLLRRHPRAMLDVPYEARETEGPSVTIALEKCPMGLAQSHPRLRLLETRGLHMDMLREPGRRADAHLARYDLAAQIARPGDTILDAACGLGYGAHLLANCSPAAKVIGVDLDVDAVEYAKSAFGHDGKCEFRTGDVANLSNIADASVDLVVSFETLEHIPDPQAALREFARVLTPGGRIIASVPNNWADETGKDPNPHHLHVYTWDMLAEQIRSAGAKSDRAVRGAESANNFLDHSLWLERAHRQMAGGGTKFTTSRRSLTPALLADDDSVADSANAEWWIAIAIKSPLEVPADVEKVKSSYRETVFGIDQAKSGNLVAFSRDYDNPWLIRSMIALGMRIARPSLLASLATHVETRARPGSSDQGAALCVLLYDVLTQLNHLKVQREATPTDQTAANDSADRSSDRGIVRRTRELVAKVSAFEKHTDANPHTLRWRVSNWFAAGLVCEALGDHSQAIAHFESCVAIDELKFSLLLATKTVEAWWRLGVLRYSTDKQAAQEAWRRGVEETKRVFASLSSDGAMNAWGSADYPLSFAIPELMNVLDVGARCGAGVRAMVQGGDVASDLWAVMASTPLQQLSEFSREASRVASAWQAQNETLRSQQQVILDAYARLQSTLVREQTAWAEAKRLEGEWKALADRIKQLPANARPAGEHDANETIRRLHAEATSLAANRDSWQQEASRLANEWQSARKLIDALRADVHRLYEEVQDTVRAKRGSDERANVLQDRVEQGATREQALSDQVTLAQQELADMKQRLASAEQAVQALRSDLHASRDQTASLSLAKQRLEQEIKAMQSRTPFRVLRSLGVVSEITLEAKPIEVLNRSNQAVDSANDRRDDQRGVEQNAKEAKTASAVSHNGDRSSQ